jgi:murein DD-endopeptidase MepM/ murein hydrolase activator NlpD
MTFTRFSAFALCVAAVISCTATPGPKAVAVPPPYASTSPSIATQATVVAPAPVRNDFILSREPEQGAIIVARSPDGARAVTLNGVDLPITADGYFLIGFDRDAENSASLVATLSDGRTVEKYLAVRPGNWDIQNVKANPLGGARTTAEFQARRGAELARINAARAKKIDSIGWQQSFIWPVKGRISGKFGSQRIYNGFPGSYHSGLDIAMPTGTPFAAPADGVVVLAARSPFTLEGHLLMIDHGMGLNSAFLHCSELLVDEGQAVKQGQIVGKVGATGRASGPHLHWGMKWNAARVDPLLLLAAG